MSEDSLVTHRSAATSVGPRSMPHYGVSPLTSHSAPRARFQPYRVLALALLVVSGVASAAVGVALGGALQDQLETGPTAAQRQSLEEIGAAKATPSTATNDPRGPNRADLGGGRADLGGGR